MKSLLSQCQQPLHLLLHLFSSSCSQSCPVYDERVQRVLSSIHRLAEEGSVQTLLTTVASCFPTTHFLFMSTLPWGAIQEPPIIEVSVSTPSYRKDLLLSATTTKFTCCQESLSTSSNQMLCVQPLFTHFTEPLVVFSTPSLPARQDSIRQVLLRSSKTSFDLLDKLTAKDR